MADYQLIIIGAGLSGLAAGIRAARFGRKVLILEQHWQPGGLNSYYYRHGHVLETGLHAMTNFAAPERKHAPLNRLLRQLKLSRRNFVTRQQIGSEIVFPEHTLRFSNDLNMLIEEISSAFPYSTDDFLRLVDTIEGHDPFTGGPRRSARQFVAGILRNRQLEDMLLLPLMVYGNSEEHDMDLDQFVIMFQAIFLEGFFRPADTIRELLTMLVDQFSRFEGEIRYRTKVRKMEGDGRRFSGVVLESGEEITCNNLLSTAGIPETARLAGWELNIADYSGRMSFTETINLIPLKGKNNMKNDRTIIFYNNRSAFDYCRPKEAIDPYWGVICFPDNFEGLGEADPFQLRITNAANYDAWRVSTEEEYQRLKLECRKQSGQQVAKIVGNYQEDVVYTDSFTPVTIERFTSKKWGAVYGSPVKFKDGRTPYDNLFIAGTDQGYLGIVGAMLSGATIVNQHLLT
jgi:all-trans-retinol 13,14-reductase